MFVNRKLKKGGRTKGWGSVSIVNLGKSVILYQW